MKRRAALAWSLLGFILYIGLPYLLVQRLGLGLVRQGSWAKPEIALTFDDGPDPASTPAVLDALREVGASATFFVLIPKAESHPALIHRMLSQGHQVELHAIKHRHAWLRSPWSALLEPSRGAARLERVTGLRLRFHRPPHGAYSLATLLGQRRAHLIGAHWNVEAHDWHPSSTPESVTARVLAGVHPGAVVVLHDAGPGARTTVAALPGLLAELGRRGYSFSTLNDLSGATPLTLARLPQRFASLLDAAFDRLGGIGPVRGRKDSLFRAARVAFPLSSVMFPNGVSLPKGTPAIEFHVNNPLIVGIGPRASVRRALRHDLHELADDIHDRPNWQSAQAVFCLSSLSPLMTFAGFETVPLPAAHTRRLTAWGNVLRRLYGSPPQAPAAHLSVMQMEVFLGKFGFLAKSGELAKK